MLTRKWQFSNSAATSLSAVQSSPWSTKPTVHGRAMEIVRTNEGKPPSINNVGDDYSKSFQSHVQARPLLARMQAQEYLMTGLLARPSVSGRNG